MRFQSWVLEGKWRWINHSSKSELVSNPVVVIVKANRHLWKTIGYLGKCPHNGCCFFPTRIPSCPQVKCRPWAWAVSVRSSRRALALSMRQQMHSSPALAVAARLTGGSKAQVRAHERLWGVAAAKLPLVPGGEESSRGGRAFHQANSAVRFWALFLRISLKSGSLALPAILRFVNRLWINSFFLLNKSELLLFVAAMDPDKHFIFGWE